MAGKIATGLIRNFSETPAAQFHDIRRFHPHLQAALAGRDKNSLFFPGGRVNDDLKAFIDQGQW